MENKLDILLKKYVNALDVNKEVECLVYTTNIPLFCDRFTKSNIQVLKIYKFINAVGIRTKIHFLENLTKLDYINYIGPTSKVLTQIDKSKKIMNLDTFYNDGYWGQNITIAVVDTGIEPHPDFVMPRYRIRKFVDLVNGKDVPYDDNGHGTFVAGVLLGNGLVSNRKYVGIAPRSNIVAIKALDASGESGSFKVLDAMQWIYENHLKYNIKVVCMSFGSEPLSKNDPLSIGVETLWRQGIVVVVAGGNSGPDLKTIKSPGINTRVITVGGLDDGRDDIKEFKIADFSSRGPVGQFYKPDIVTPAVNIVSNNKNIINGKGYTIMSGTSVATPMIAGVCALVLQKHPNLTPEQVKRYIIKCGVPITGNRNEEGFGLFIAK